MEDLILKIIDIEDRAQELIKDAKKANKELDKNITDETCKLHHDIERRAHAKSMTLKEMELKEADKKCESIRANAQKQIESLKQKYEENKDSWVDAIVKNIVGG